MSAQFQWYGDKLTAEIQAQTATGLNLAGEHLRGVSQRQVPHMEGTLEASAAVNLDPTGHTVAVSYDTPYARRQHEELTYHHPHGRKAKYLEDPLRNEAKTMVALLAAQVRRAM